MRSFGRRLPMLLVVLSVALIAADRWASPTPLRALGSAVFGSLESVASSATRWPADTGRIERLERENARLRAALLATGRPSGPKKNKHDKGDKSPMDRYRVVPAHAIGFGRDRTVTIDVGSAAGVARDMTVFDSDGLIGRVIQAGPATATVQLITSPSASVGARLAGSREVGVVKGVADHGADGGLIRLSLLNPEASVSPGDHVVTLGSPNLRPYVPDVPIGSVVSVEDASGGPTRTALVRPFARFSALDLVTVVLGSEAL
ncbi:rod shape-determining protein MreC [Sphaerimonospora thailandensis]|uniref:Cell shape-determining protein MreC n=1 Tax=Sphaerimonospora thailandensis TaxID=795644 RepID=A0A8J3R7N1_9ACTN|nr:rod shape-determining protein MreC [Sphaerimonospora thailandensis]GIH68934.1 rod shape-determining protein MreC [Sphaerimonospora thailandensis]